MITIPALMKERNEDLNMLIWHDMHANKLNLERGEHGEVRSESNDRIKEHERIRGKNNERYEIQLRLYDKQICRFFVIYQFVLDFSIPGVLFISSR